jgi:hypothetical protein
VARSAISLDSASLALLCQSSAAADLSCTTLQASFSRCYKSAILSSTMAAWMSPSHAAATADALASINCKQHFKHHATKSSSDTIRL